MPIVGSEHWVIVKNMPDGGTLVECKRCQARLEVKFPCRVDDWLAAVRSFDDRHRQCQEESRAQL